MAMEKHARQTRLSAVEQTDEAAIRKWLKDAIVSIGDIEVPSTELTTWKSLRGSLLWQDEDIISPFASDKWESSLR
jgi:hypothetical protein